MLGAYLGNSGIGALCISNHGAIGRLLAFAGGIGQLLADLVGRIGIPVDAGGLSGRCGARNGQRGAQLSHDHAKQARLIGHARPGAGL